MMSFAGLSLLLALVQAVYSLTLSELCTPSNIQRALPSNGTLLGINVLPDTVTAAVANSSSSSQAGGGGPKRKRQMPPSPPSSSAASMDYCNVTFSYTHPGKGDVVKVKYGLPSPKTYKSRFYLAGGGGYSLSADATGGLLYGAVSGATDAGYDGFNDSFDEKALYGNGSINWDATYMFSYQALGELTQIGKHLSRKVYSTSQLYTYFSGCSDGGRQAMSQVQRYGHEYDGVVAGAPVVRFAQQQVQHIFPATIEKTLNYYPKPCALQKIVNATIETCDAYDGRKDGVVSRSDLCKLNFKLTSIIGQSYYCAATTASSLGFGFSRRAMMAGGAAPGSQTASYPEQKGTITAKDVEVAQAVYDGLHDSRGKRAYLSWQIASSLDDADTAYNNVSDTWTLNLPGTAGTYIRKFIELLDLDSLANLDNVTYDTLVDWMNIGFNRYYDSLQTTLIDLTPFQERGGKLIHYHGESDPSVPAASSVHYRQAVRDAMYPTVSRGKAEARLSDWYKFYLVPGAAHCGVNSLQPGPYPTDLVNQMIDWVENKHAPTGLNATVSSGTHSGETQFLCQWPKRPLWRSSTAFDCVHDAKSIKSWTYSFPAFKQAVY